MKKLSKKKPINKKKPTSTEILQAALDVLNRIIEKKEDKAPLKEEVIREPIDPEQYIADMKNAVLTVLEQSHNHALIFLDDYYAIICRKVILDVHVFNNSNIMMPYENTKERTFCVLHIIGWSDSLKNNEFIQLLISLGARYDDVCLASDIKDKIV